MAKKERTLKITLIKSPIGNTERHKATLRALGLRKIGQSVEQKDSLAVRGMLSKVNHLVEIEIQE
jgi:large subunit ribosomal protein L30